MPLAFALLWAAGCGPGPDKAIAPAEVERQIVHLNDGSSFARADAAKMLGASASEKAVEPLSAALKDDSARVRAAAAKALGDLRDIRALWPLTVTAATDIDPKVRDAAAEAVTWLGPEPDSYVSNEVRKSLLQRLPDLKIEDAPLNEPFSLLQDMGNFSMLFKGDLLFEEKKRVTIIASEPTLAEAYCRLFVASGDRLAFVVGVPDYPMVIGSVPELIARVRAAKGAAAWREKRQAYAARTPEGRETLRKLETVLSKSPSEGVPLSDMLTYLSDLSGARTETDWAALKAIGIESDCIVELGVHKRPPAIWLCLEEALARASYRPDGKGSADFYVEGAKVIVTTRSAVEARVGKVPTAPDAERDN